MQLNPGENFVITHQIGDHTDATTYYVRAVIRNALTDATLDTVNLIDRGTQRFSAPWQVPADPSGQGFYISVTTTVYTDSGYSAKSALYSEEQERHLIQVRDNPNLGMGGGVGVASGPDIDYKKVRKIIQEELAKIEFPEVKIPAQVKPQEISLEPVQARIAALNGSLQAISDKIESLPRFEKTEINLEPFESRIEELGASIAGLNEYLGEMEEIFEKSFGSHGNVMSEMVTKHIEAIKNDITMLTGKIEEMQGGTLSLDLSSLPDIKARKESKKEKEEVPSDVQGILRRSFIRRNTRKN